MAQTSNGNSWLKYSIFTYLPFLHIFTWILRTVMYQSAETHPELSQTSKINIFPRIVNILKLTLLTIFGKSFIMGVWSALITPLTCFSTTIKCFPVHEQIKLFWRHQTCKLYQNRLVFMIVFGTHFDFFIVFPVCLKTCRCNGFFVFTRQNVSARKIGRVSEVLCARVQFIQAC